MHYVVFLSISPKNFSLATLARLYFCPPAVINASMQRDSFNPSYISLHDFALLSLTANFQNALKHVQNHTKLRIKSPNIVFSWGSDPHPSGGAYDALPNYLMSVGRYDKLPLSQPSIHVQCPLPEKKHNLLDRHSTRHDASANNGNRTKSEIAQNKAIFC